LIDEIGKAPGSWVGRNLAYKPVVVKSAKNLLGEALNVRVTNAFPTYLEGEIAE
jgi:tRNA A37 methylthiotransferase MiaB